MKLTIKPEVVKRYLKADEAIALLSPHKSGKKLRIHTFSSAIIALLGCDMDYSPLKKRIREAAKRDIQNVQIAGRNMRGVGHGVALWTKHGWLFIEADANKVNELIKTRNIID
jgi:uncharacterized membrane protein YdfJ with MMPL/SSD domain